MPTENKKRMTVGVAAIVSGFGVWLATVLTRG
jgi:hypothetical protein